MHNGTVQMLPYDIILPTVLWDTQYLYTMDSVSIPHPLKQIVWKERKQREGKRRLFLRLILLERYRYDTSEKLSNAWLSKPEHNMCRGLAVKLSGLSGWVIRMCIRILSLAGHIACVLEQDTQEFNQCTSGILFFSGPPCGIIFSEKSEININKLSMKQSPDNQINAFSHWHLENSMASFFITVVFLQHN